MRERECFHVGLLQVLHGTDGVHVCWFGRGACRAWVRCVWVCVSVCECASYWSTVAQQALDASPIKSLLQWYLSRQGIGWVSERMRDVCKGWNWPWVWRLSFIIYIPVFDISSIHCKSTWRLDGKVFQKHNQLMNAGPWCTLLAKVTQI